MTTLTPKAREILNAELPFDSWKVGTDIRVEEDTTEVRVYPISAHAIEQIGQGQHLSFSK